MYEEYKKKNTKKYYTCGEAEHVKKNYSKAKEQTENALVPAKFNVVNARETVRNISVQA